MNELHEWLKAHRIAYRPIDREVVEIEGLGKLFLADLSGVESIFRVRGAEVEFNLMEHPEVLLSEGIEYVVFPFGDNWYYYSLREGFALNILKYVGRRVPCKRKTPFVNLGVHTPYELLNASGDVSQWVRKAAWMGHTALGICDRNTMGATLALQKACDKAGIRPVIGYTCTLAHESEKVEVKIYCQSQRGLRNLLRIQKAVMVDAADATIPLPELLRRGEGNVLVFGKLSPCWMENNLHAVKALRETFDKVFYQVDLSEYKAERLDAEVLKATAHFFHTFYDERNDSFLVEPILITDCYYPDKDDARTKTVLNKIATGAAHAQSDDQYFKDIDEHYTAVRALFDGERWNTDALFERMCRHTVEIAEGAEARYQTERNYMPRYDMTAEERQRYGDTHTMFLSLLEEGFSKLVPAEQKDKYRKRLDKEIYILESTDNIDYMLVQYDTVNWARRNGILVGCGRGSAGGCLALYLLGITLIDPIRYNLLFERFLLPERAGLYPAKATKLVGTIASTSYVKLCLSNGQTVLFDRDARLAVRRGEKQIEVYADELREGDDILFDNRDLLFEINKDMRYGR
ncbi:MAG: PHP domain-containing protein [Alistipes sp.]|uniref:PHP domain-containing protein n=1 Tax=Butyricimonas muris TaxID=3378067 RepID=UPI003966B451